MSSEGALGDEPVWLMLRVKGHINAIRCSEQRLLKPGFGKVFNKATRRTYLESCMCAWVMAERKGATEGRTRSRKHIGGKNLQYISESGVRATRESRFVTIYR